MPSGHTSDSIYRRAIRKGASAKGARPLLLPQLRIRLDLGCRFVIFPPAAQPIPHPSANGLPRAAATNHRFTPNRWHTMPGRIFAAETRIPAGVVRIPGGKFPASKNLLAAGVLGDDEVCITSAATQQRRRYR